LGGSKEGQRVLDSEIERERWIDVGKTTSDEK
jgi:hypothetical protein